MCAKLRCLRLAMTLTILRPMMFRDVMRRLAFSIPPLAIACAMAGCASRSLNPPPVVERSTGMRANTAPPGSVVTAPDGSTQLYTVKRDDTLFGIAKRFNTSPAELASWNNLGTDPRLRADQVLQVSRPNAPSPSAAAVGSDNAPVAVAQPIGGESIEQRPLTSPGASPPVAPPGNAPMKTGPLGLKRPYSDATLAEFSKPDAGASPSATVVPEAAKPPATDVAARVAWAWPASGKVVDTFVDGKVIFSGSRVRGYGNFVIVRHSADLLSVYAHNKTNLVKEDAVVTKGQKIAEMGSTDADSVKLHFEIRQGGKPVDPLKFLPER